MPVETGNNYFFLKGEKRMSYSKDPVKKEEQLRRARERARDPEFLKKIADENRRRSQDPEWIRRNKEGAIKRAQDPEWKRKQKEGIQKKVLDPTWRENQFVGAQKRADNPEWIRNVTTGAIKRSQTESWIKNHTEAMDILHQDPEWRRKNKEMLQQLTQTPEWILKNKIATSKLSSDPEWLRKVRASGKRTSENVSRSTKIVEFLIGGFWYGNIRYSRTKRYCELWCRDLWDRIDAAQDYKSIISGKTKEDNGGRALDRHHVYWQPKACCEWDEDAQGYYVMINIGSARYPNIVRHNIDGDPNKFVLLTRSEHMMVSKDKLKWIKIFEDLIESELDGICYLPKEED